MTTMDRRQFLRRGALIVPAAALATEEARSGLVTGWVRRFFPGFGPGTITRTLKYQGGYADDLARAQVELNRQMSEYIAQIIEADLQREAAITALFAKPSESIGGSGLYVEVRHAAH